MKFLKSKVKIQKSGRKIYELYERNFKNLSINFWKLDYEF